MITFLPKRPLVLTSAGYDTDTHRKCMDVGYKVYCEEYWTLLGSDRDEYQMYNDAVRVALCATTGAMSAYLT